MRESAKIEGFEERTDESSESSLEQDKTEKRIKREKEWARENFSGLIELVNKRYEGPESTLTDSPAQLESFKKHNGDILDFCVERGIQKGLSKRDLRTVEIAAVLHDLAKGDKPPAEKSDINNYILVAHGELAAREARGIIERNSEILNKILGKKHSKKETEEVITAIEKAIRCHMGPHPGFMTGMLENVNKELRKRGETEIEHSYPPKGDAVAETLLTADMGSLADKNGRRKVLAIRYAVPFFKKEDNVLSEEYKKQGVKMTPGEAALLSGFKSAKEARDMIKNPRDRDWINGLIRDSEKETYLYGLGEELEIVNFREATGKKDEFEMARAKKELEEGSA